jgi:hypothetical protein
MLAVMSSGHPLSKSASLVPEQLLNQKIVLIQHEKEHEYHVRSLFKLYDLRMADIRYAEHIDTLPFVLEECQGIFIGVWPLVAIPDVDLVSVPVASQNFFCEMGFLHQHDYENPAITTLLDCASRLYPTEKIR